MNLKQAGSNQTILNLNADTQIFFSYETPVAGLINGELVKTEKYFSGTTSRHINRYLDGRTATEKPQSFFNEMLKGK